jgi:hypothetical protein
MAVPVDHLMIPKAVRGHRKISVPVPQHLHQRRRLGRTLHYRGHLDAHAG